MAEQVEFSTRTCGCKLEKNPFLTIIYCPMHKAAPAMLEALVWGLNDYDNDVPFGGACVEAQRKAIARARGQEAGA